MKAKQFASAYSMHYRTTLRWLLSRGVSPALAEEVAQAAWVRGWERRHSLRDAGKICPWVNAIALNMLRNEIRVGKSHLELHDDLDSPLTDALSDRCDADAMMAQLSSEDRSMLVMHVVEGFTSREIADERNISPVAVRVRLCRAKAWLRNQFANRPGISRRLVRKGLESAGGRGASPTGAGPLEKLPAA